jgi:hypothetical protein
MHLDRALLRTSWQSWISSDNRRRAGPYWLQWVWTLLFGAAIALPFTVVAVLASARGAELLEPAAWAHWYGRNLIVCVTIASLIHLLFDIGRLLLATPERLARWQPWQRTAYFSGLPMLGVVIGWPIGLVLAGAELSRWLRHPEGLVSIAGSVAVALLITFAFHHYFAAKTREIDTARRATETQLKLLQAQIEPHFLFNTLANVQSLMEHDPPRARQMLASFTEYLRATLGTLRQDDSTVADELALARSYLELLQVRMDERLRFRIEADEAARSQPLPPLLLQPLVENAIVHGLEPSIAGGLVHVSARVQGASLVLQVLDDGRGPTAAGEPLLPAASPRTGHGLALENIRQRLRTRYGDAARLSIEAASPGTRARIELPLVKPDEPVQPRP